MKLLDINLIWIRFIIIIKTKEPNLYYWPKVENQVSPAMPIESNWYLALLKATSTLILCLQRIMHHSSLIHADELELASHISNKTQLSNIRYGWRSTRRPAISRSINVYGFRTKTTMRTKSLFRNIGLELRSHKTIHIRSLLITIMCTNVLFFSAKTPSFSSLFGTCLSVGSTHFASY